MGYPTHAQIEQTAGTLRLEKLAVYAFAGLHQRLPRNTAEMDAFGIRAGEFAQMLGRSVDEVYGFVQARGTWPWSYEAFKDLQTDAGIWDVNRRWTGKIMYPGLGYPPGSPLDGSRADDDDDDKGEPGFSITAWLAAHPWETIAVAAGLFILLSGKKR